MTQAYTILIYSITYLSFFALLWLSKEKKGIRLLDENGPVKNRRMLFVLHIGGILLFGILPIYFLNHFSLIVFGKNFPEGTLSAELTGLLVILSIIITPLLAEKQTGREAGSASVGISFSNLFITNYFFVRILFLCAYEIWFRGYLLTDCLNSFGVPLAIFLNVGLYTLLHIVNGKKEMLACIPLGLLQCSLCVWMGAAWPAIVLHIVFTVSYETRQVRIINKPSNSFI